MKILLDFKMGNFKLKCKLLSTTWIRNDYNFVNRIFFSKKCFISRSVHAISNVFIDLRSTANFAWKYHTKLAFKIAFTGVDEMDPWNFGPAKLCSCCLEDRLINTAQANGYNGIERCRFDKDNSTKYLCQRHFFQCEVIAMDRVIFLVHLFKQRLAVRLWH